MPSEFVRPEPSRPGTSPGGITSPGISSPPGAISADVASAPPDAVAIVRRGPQVPDATFLHELLVAECPSVLERKVPLVPLTQRQWWASEDLLVAGAKEFAGSLQSEHQTNPQKATWHVTYGPGHAKVLLIFLRR
jgi:hypothetical protein